VRLAAEEPTTWHVDPNAANTLRVMQRFERLQHALGPNAFDQVPAPRVVSSPTQGVAVSSARRTKPTRSRARPSARQRRANRRLESLIGAAVFLILAAVFLTNSKQITALITSFLMNSVTPSP